MPSLSPILPEFRSFEAAFSKAQAQLLWTVQSADLDTPVAAMMRLREEGKPSFLLESVEKGAVRGRYSIIGLRPDLIFRCFGSRAEMAYSDTLAGADFKPCKEPSLDAFRALVRSSTMPIPPGLPPMSAGLFGYMAYDMVKEMERLPARHVDTLSVPDACFMRASVMVIFDSATDSLYIVTPVWEAKGDAKTAYDAAIGRIREVQERLRAPLPEAAKPPQKPVVLVDFKSNTDRKTYDAMIDSAREYIAAGDIFQVVLSQRFSAPFTLPPFSLYRALRYLNPSPFLVYLDFCDFQLVASSPEIMVRLRDGRVTIRPIAGTRKRGKDATEDAELAADLLSDPKELSEHLMLLDLGRNDVGRVAKIGSVETTQRMHIENYSHVMHIVSNVEGDLDDTKYDAVSALIAGFPAGTVSGAPKIRAMEIIDELEVEKRSFYGGCMGYFSASGDMDTCIALRTGLIKDGMLHIQSGGGIVADSSAEGEYQESVNKAKALMRAAEEAIQFV